MSSKDTGIEFVNTIHETELSNIITYEYFYNGGGVALGDINNDGLTDIYFTSNIYSNKLYLNLGDFKFKDITERSNTGCEVGWKTGVSMVDINSDGLLDIYVCRSASPDPGRRENILLVNNGDLTFTDKASEYNLNDPSFSTHSAFFDYDRDGDLDMFLLNHSLLPLSNSYSTEMRYKTGRVDFVGNRLYRNDLPEKGVFTDVSDSLGIYGSVSNYGLGVAIGDLNNDRWPDIYVSNDYTEKDKLYLNKRGVFFQESSESLLSQMSQSSMGVEIVDVNNDGYFDVFSLDMLPKTSERQKEFFWMDNYNVHFSRVKRGLHYQYMRNMLHLNNGDSTFSEIGQLAGITNTDWSWASLFADFDSDGLQDLFVSNGFKRNFSSYDFLKTHGELIGKIKNGQSSGSLIKILDLLPIYKTQNNMFQNMDGLKFNDVSSQWGFDELTLSNGAAYADLDNDGDLDLVVNNIDEEAGIYKNNASENGNRFLKVRLYGKDNNTFGLGAKVKIYHDGNLKTRALSPYGGFQSSVDPVIHFGLGKADQVDSLIIEWPQGESQTLFNVKTNQLLQLYQKDATAKVDYPPTFESPCFVKGDSIPFIHKENDFIDFKVQPLLARMYSGQGPALAIADVDDDGLQDLFIGGAKGQSGSIMMQNKKGSYENKVSSIFALDSLSEDVDASFFDMDGDGDQDLYVVSGGYEFEKKEKFLQDRLYRNEGNGNFTKIDLPPFYSSGSCVRPSDIDNDGDIDLFVGGRLVPGRYPEMPESYLLTNDGKGKFAISTKELAPELSKVGLVTDAVWIDLNQDNYQDLIVVGEWMPVKVFINNNGRLIDQSSEYFDGKIEGWWNVIKAEDMDNDGDIDLIVGNFGMNNQFKPTGERPVTLYYADYDNNGVVDPIMNYFIVDKSYPMATYDELVRQTPSFKPRFKSYKSYASSTIDDILTPKEISNSQILTAYTFHTTYFQNDGGKFVARSLPVQAQYAPVMAIEVMDVNHDGNKDLVLAGNISEMNVRHGKASGNFGTVLLGDGSGGFEYLPSRKSGISIKGDVRNIVKDNERLIFGVNGEAPLSYDLQ